MTLQLRTLLAFFLALFALSGCGDVWLGSEKKLNIKGERISLIKRSADFKPENNGKNYTFPKPETVKDWPTSNANYKFTAQNIHVEALADDYITRFSFSSSSDVASASSPVIGDDKLFMLGTDGVISAFDTKTGTILWQNDLLKDMNKKSFFDFFSHNFVSGGLLYHNETLYITSGYNNIMAINTKNGEAIWNVKLSSPTRSVPILFGDTVIVQTIDNKIFSVNRADGKILWAHFGIANDLNALASFLLDTSGTSIAAQYSTGEVALLNAKTGDEVWNETVSSPIDSSHNEMGVTNAVSAPIIVKNKVVSYGADSYVAALDLKTGKSIWRKEFMLSKPFAISGDAMLAVNDYSMLFAADISDGGIIWCNDLSSFNSGDLVHDNWTTPVVFNNQIFVVSSKGLAVLFDLQSGATVKTINVPTNIFNKPIVTSNGVYLTSLDGYIYKY